MVFMKTAGENVSLINPTGVPYGLGALYVGGDGIDEVLDAGINAFAVWVLGPDAEFEIILAPAFRDHEAVFPAWRVPGGPPARPTSRGPSGVSATPHMRQPRSGSDSATCSTHPLVNVLGHWQARTAIGSAPMRRFW